MKKLFIGFLFAALMVFFTNGVFACDCGCKNEDCKCNCHKECPVDCDCGCHKGEKCTCKKCKCGCHGKCNKNCKCTSHKKFFSKFKRNNKIKCNCDKENTRE